MVYLKYTEITLQCGDHDRNVSRCLSLLGRLQVAITPCGKDGKELESKVTQEPEELVGYLITNLFNVTTFVQMYHSHNDFYFY